MIIVVIQHFSPKSVLILLILTLVWAPSPSAIVTAAPLFSAPIISASTISAGTTRSPSSGSHSTLKSSNVFLPVIAGIDEDGSVNQASYPSQQGLSSTNSSTIFLPAISGGSPATSGPDFRDPGQEQPVDNTPGNSIPILFEPEFRAVMAGRGVAYSINARDPDGNRLTYQATGLPPGLTLDSITGNIFGYANVPGEYNVTIQANDGYGGQAQASILWRIIPTGPLDYVGEAVPTPVGGPNREPTITHPGDQHGTVGELVRLALGVTEPDGDTLSFFASRLPAGLIIDASSGEISGTPTDAGLYNVTIQAADEYGASHSITFNWLISRPAEVNQAPKLLPIRAQSAVVGDKVFQTIGSSDPDGDSLRFEAQGLPPALYIERESGLILGNIASAGSYEVTVTATDIHGTSDSITTIWTISPPAEQDASPDSLPAPNRSPSITLPEEMVLAVGMPVYIIIGASDADGDVLTFSAVNLPPGLTLDSDSGLISGTVSDAGIYETELTADDGRGGTTKALVWAIKDITSGNTTPVLQRPDDQRHYLGETVSLAIGATDADGDTLRYQATGLPDGLSLQNHTIVGTIESTGTFTVTLSVDDGWGGIASSIFAWRVTLPPTINRPPSLTVPGPQNNTLHDAVFVDVGAYDPEGDQLIYSATDLPPGLSIDSISGQITGELAAEGTYNSIITVEDGEMGVANATIIWIVGPYIPNNRAPNLIPPHMQRSTVGDVVDLTVIGTDPDQEPLTFSATGLPPGLSINDETGQISGSATEIGIYQIALIVRDPKGGQEAAGFSWMVETVGLGSGEILLERWKDVGGSTIDKLQEDANYPYNPSTQQRISSFELTANVGDDYGSRTRGYVHAPISGDYTFWIAGDDRAELWLSNDNSPGNASLIAQVSDWTALRQWDKFPEQQSVSVRLEAGQKYYIESIQKESTGDDHLSVAWQVSGWRQQIIEGRYLSPFVPNIGAGKAVSQSSIREDDHTWAGYRAVDKLVDTHAQTAEELEPWWEIDLGDTYALSSMTIWSREDCCPEQLSNFNVFISNQPLGLFNGAAPTQTPTLTTTLTSTQTTVHEISYPGTVDGEAEIRLNQTGRYLRIQKVDQGMLALAEVAIFGLPPAETATTRPSSVLSITPIGETDASEKSGRKVPLRVSRTVAAGEAQITFSYAGAQEPTSGSATLADFELVDEDGNKLADNITLAAFEYERTVWAKALPDDLIEVPEVVRVHVEPSEAFQLAPTQSEVTIQIVDDLPGFTDQSRLFVAPLSAEGMAETTASGVATIRLSNDNNYGLINVSFSGLTSLQSAAHLHYANPLSGPVVFSIPLGQVSNEQWDIRAAHQATTDQAMLDALFAGQLYINIHSGSYPDGEIRGTAFVATASNDFQPPASAPAYEQLSESELRYDILRFLGQSTMGTTPEAIADLEDKITAHGGDRIAAYGEWLDEQMLLEAPSMLNFYEANYAMWADGLTGPAWETALLASHSRQSGFYEAWFTSAVYSKAQLRERVAFALSQILVVSNQDDFIGRRPWLGASYLDMLKTNSFGRYENLLYDVSLHPAMGHYLSMLRNRATIHDADGNPISSPDENYAREIIQLFSVGLLELHPDGSLKLDGSGLPIETYGLQDISELARIFTGWAYAKTLSALDSPAEVENTDFDFAGYNADRPDGANFTRYHPYYSAALKQFEDNGLPAADPAYERYHDNNEKSVLGQTFSSGRGGEDEMRDVVQMLTTHENAGAFLAYRLIQRMVTSNPSAGYVYRVAQVYESSSGDLGQVVRAILLDPEARNLNQLNQAGIGRAKEYLYQYTASLRTLRATSQYTDTYSLNTLVDFGYPSDEIALYDDDARIVYTAQCTLDCNLTINQAPMRAPSVFNWYSPEYAPAGSLSQAGLVMPEMQHATESVVIAFYNLMNDYILGDGNQGYAPKYGLSEAFVTHRYTQAMADAYMLVMDTDNDESISTADHTVDRPDLIRAASAAMVDIADEYLCSGQLMTNATGDPATDPREIIVDGVVNTHSFWDYSSNLAGWKHANQSSLSSGGYHWRAVDGNVDGYYPNSSVTQTELELNPWWQVNLEANGFIEKIRIWGRSHCCEERLQDFYILISDTPFESENLSEVLAQPGVTSIYVGPQVNLFKTFPVNRSGQYVRIQLAGTNHLNLAEVQVLGPGADPIIYQPAQAHFVRDERIKEALYLVGTAPQCLIQK